MTSRAARIVVFVACLHVMGGHWIALQTVAWAKMFVESSRHVSVAAALGQTFSGEHPCSLCTAIDEGQHEEGGQQMVDPTAKVNAVLPAIAGLPPRRASSLIRFCSAVSAQASVYLTLPSPPPQRA